MLKEALEEGIYVAEIFKKLDQLEANERESALILGIKKGK